MNRSRIALPALILGLIVDFAGPTAAWAAEDCDELPASLLARIEDEQDAAELHALDLLLTLDLTPQQGRAMLPLYERACRLHMTAHEKRAELQPLMIEAYTAFLEEDRLNQGFTPDVEKRTGHVHHLAKQAREAHVAEMIKLEARFHGLLSPRQQQSAATYRPGHKAIAKALRSQAERQGKILPVSSRREQRRAGPANRPVAPAAAELAEARQELRGLNERKHPRLGTVGRFLLTPAAAVPLYKLAGVNSPATVEDSVTCWRHGTRDYPLEECRQDEKQIHAIKREINNWNLVNGLHLDQQQLRALVTLNEEWERLHARQWSGDEWRQMKPSQFRLARFDLEQAADEVLNPGQREVLAEYKPCLLPPKNLKNPVRVGQAQDDSHLTRWLERVRQMKPRRVEGAIDRLIAKQEEHFGPLPEGERTTRRNEIRNVVHEAADMLEAEFELSKLDLAMRIMPEDQYQSLQNRIVELEYELGRCGRTAKFLLNESMAQVLRVRYGQLGK